MLLYNMVLILESQGERQKSTQPRDNSEYVMDVYHLKAK